MFITADEAKRDIATAIDSGDATADEFDIDAIFDATYEYSTDLQAFVQTVDVDGFWAAVMENLK